MPIKSELYNGVCVVSVIGDLTAEESVEFKKNVNNQIEQKQCADFVVDMEQCSFADSEGLETLLWLKKQAEDLFGVMKMAHPDENIKKILEITRLSHRFDTHEELSAALKTMR